MMRSKLWLSFLLCLITIAAGAKDQPTQIVVWPDVGAPVLRFSFAKFKQIGSVGAERTYEIDTTAENLSGKLIPNANFFIYLFDKNKVRIGDGWITLTNVESGQIVRFQTTVSASGVPVSLTVEPRSSSKTVTITVNSVPQGADVKLDGVSAGTTPKLLQVAVGKHMLEFSKEGFNSGHFPLEIGPSDTSGGSVSYELGTSARDTVELRDGIVLSGDLESVSATEVIIRIGGASQHFNRNQVKRILLVERDAPAQ